MKTSVSAGGIVLREGKVVLVQQYKSSWSLPKGHVDDGESPLEAAKREILEETGLAELELVRKLGSFQRSGRSSSNKREFKTIIMFLFHTKQSELKPIDKAISEAIWVRKGDVAEMLTRKEDKEFFLKCMKELE